MMKMRKRRALVLAGSALALTVALSGCSAISSILGGGTADADRDEETGQVTDDANIGIFALKVGDCKLESPDGLLENADVVPCDKEHDEEVYYEITMPDGDFSEEDIDAASYECIGDPFTEFVGIANEESALQVYPITPTKDTWEQLNDRIIQCVILDPAGPVTGSLKDSAR
ncbi:MAG: hypothetical protein P0Y60_11785 [Candidatus Microbacterium colombiense]|nr:MAG: hypothetical protein P0Y60_11785 [Microbacterium sp.]